MEFLTWLISWVIAPIALGIMGAVIHHGFFSKPKKTNGDKRNDTKRTGQIKRKNAYNKNRKA